MADSSRTVVNVSIAMIILSTVFTGLRFWSRSLQNTDRKYWWDDFFALMLLPLCIIISSLAIGWSSVGLGKHTYEVLMENPENLTVGLKYLFWGSFVYDLGISAAKFSALFFYVRVFGLKQGDRWWKIAIYSSFAFSVAWIIMALFLTIFQCDPVSGAWNKMTRPPPKCLAPINYFVPNSATNFVNDLLIVVIPIPRVFQLQMKPLKKILIVGVLLCGYITVFMTIGQLVLVSRDSQRLEQDVFYYAEPIIIWGNTQPSIALISLCLPSLFHLIKRAAKYGSKSLFSSRDPSPLVEKNMPRENPLANRLSLRPLRMHALPGSASSSSGPPRKAMAYDDVELGDVGGLSQSGGAHTAREHETV